MKNPTLSLLKKWLRMHGGIRGNFLLFLATYERVGNTEIIGTRPWYLETENQILLSETNSDEIYRDVLNVFLQ